MERIVMSEVVNEKFFNVVVPTMRFDDLCQTYNDYMEADEENSCFCIREMSEFNGMVVRAIGSGRYDLLLSMMDKDFNINHKYVWFDNTTFYSGDEVEVRKWIVEKSDYDVATYILDNLDMYYDELPSLRANLNDVASISHELQIIWNNDVMYRETLLPYVEFDNARYNKLFSLIFNNILSDLRKQYDVSWHIGIAPSEDDNVAMVNISNGEQNIVMSLRMEKVLAFN